MVESIQLRQQRPFYPFTAVVGQEEAKTVLIINAIDPTMGGALVSGPKGTGKSLLVNSFSRVLPDVEQVQGCPYHCSPRDPTNMCASCKTRFFDGGPPPVETTPMRLVHVPLSVTEDMLVGSIDLDKAVTMGAKALDKGLLAEANQSILYIDEVNLLPDHITDSILDAAASGWNIVEREGVSVQHPSRFILVGTMNPEEGELRPQLADRFALHITVESIYDTAQRVEIIKRNLEFGDDPVGFSERFREDQNSLRDQIIEARAILRDVEVPDEYMTAIASACISLHVDGHRPDISTVRAAKALAALDGRRRVSPGDVQRVAVMAVGYRTRGFGFEEPAKPAEVRDTFRKVFQGLQRERGT